MNTPMMNFIHTPYGYCYYDLDKPVSDGGTYLILGCLYTRNTEEMVIQSGCCNS